MAAVSIPAKMRLNVKLTSPFMYGMVGKMLPQNPFRGSIFIRAVRDG